MKIVGLCKMFSGYEFLEALLEEAYPEIDKFIFVSSDKNWQGEKKENKVLPVLKNWMHENDKENKIEIINTSLMDQMDQYEEGYKHIKIKYPDTDWIFVFDTDEVWEKAVLQKAKKKLEECFYYNAVHCNMKTYIKSPFYKVSPAEYNKPTCFIRPCFSCFPGVRGNAGKPSIFIPDLYFHHFTYVRKYEKDVIEKIKTSFIGDQYCTVKCMPVDLDEWYKTKWRNLPYSKNFHTTQGFESSWKEIEIVTKNDLPESLKGKDILNNFNLMEDK